MPPRSSLIFGMTVAIANASNATRVIMSTRPSVNARRPGAHTPSRAPASSVCTQHLGARLRAHDPPGLGAAYGGPAPLAAEEIIVGALDNPSRTHRESSQFAE